MCTALYLREIIYLIKRAYPEIKLNMDIYQGPLEGIKGLLIYQIANMEFCSDVKNIAAILRMDEVEKLKKHNSLHQILYHQSIFKTIDLHKIYGLKPIKTTKNIRIILLELFGKRFCFMVDNVIEILTTDSMFIDNSLDLIPYSDKSFIKSILKYQNRKIYLPDFEKITKELDKITGVLQPVHL